DHIEDKLVKNTNYVYRRFTTLFFDQSTTNDFSRWLATNYYDEWAVVAAACGWLTSTRRPILIAAMVSAGPANPHDTHLKSSLVFRFSFATCPHWGHVRDVLAGSTSTTGTPARRALYSMNVRS